jgi:uncharacterized membrane protein YphA (DoxX/SURF4 family)
MITNLLLYLRRFDYPVTARSFALFRILFALYFTGLIFQLNGSSGLYFDHVSGISQSLFPAKATLFLWAGLNLMLLFGMFTRYAAAANYIVTVIMTSFFVNSNISSFNDDLLRIGSFLIIFLPVARCWSLDALFTRLNAPSAQKQTSYLYYLLMILMSLGLLYFGSGVCKVFSPMWQKGLGLWTPAVMPYNKWNPLDLFTDQPWIMYSLNYIVILFELMFVFLLFNRKAHLYITLTGIGFHLGIALLFPFTYISLGPIVFYSLLLPDSFWNRLNDLIESTDKETVYFNPVSRPQQVAAAFIRTFDLRKRFTFVERQGRLAYGEHIQWDAVLHLSRKLPLLWKFSLLIRIPSVRMVLRYASDNWLAQTPAVTETDPGTDRLRRFSFYTFTAVLCGIQLLYLAYHSYAAIRTDPAKKRVYLKQRIATQDFSTKPSNLARTLFGINSRGVFLDHAFAGTKTVFALSQTQADGTEQWLPVFDKNGYCELLNRNLNWHKLTFRYFAYNALLPDTNGLKKFSMLWMKQNRLAPDDIHLTVYRRRYPYPTEYEKGYLDKMLKLPWDTVGLIHWKDSVFHYSAIAADSTR